MFKKQFLRGVLLYALSLSAQSAILISVNSGTPQINTGDIVSFTIDISGLGSGVALSSYALSVGFKPVLLQFNSAFFGDPLLGDQLDIAGLGLNAPSALAGDNFVNLIEFSLDDSAPLLEKQAHNFTLASLFFTAISPGISTLDLTIDSLSDTEGNNLSADSANSFVSINAVPIPGAFWLFATTLALLMRRQTTIYKIK
jgi:hypothetical protein